MRIFLKIPLSVSPTTIQWRAIVRIEDYRSQSALVGVLGLISCKRECIVSHLSG
jgi:hypothetical protein